MSFNYEQSIWGKGQASLAWSRPTSFRLRQALNAIKGLRIESQVLELGCGAGQFIRAIKQLRPELSCLGCDISESALAAAREENDGVIYSLSGVVLPYADRSLAAVLIFDVLEHVDNVTQLLNEIYRVLKPNGIVYAFVPCEGDFLSLWHWLDRLHLKNDLTKKYAGHIQYFSRPSILRAFEEANFELTRVRYSELLFGQLIGITAFFMVHQAATRQGLKQLNNECYFDGPTKVSPPSGLVKKIKQLINCLIYLESTVLQYVPSPNVHLVVKKKPAKFL